MSMFQTALTAYLEPVGFTEAGLALAIGKSQVAIHRYRKGDRFPDADTARAIAEATEGQVPFEAWQHDFMAKSGLAA